VNATSITEPEARALVDAINQVSASQPPAESMKLVDAALARAPQQPIVLNAAAGHMMRSGDARRARELYERAIALDRGSKVLWLNLATACRSLGDKKAEGVALEKALEIEPRYVPALLQKAELMERLDNRKAAATVYQAALDCVASGTPVAQNMAAALTHAQELVNANARELEAFLEQEVASVRQQHAGADQQRYDACRDVFLRKRRVYMHEPKGFLFPYLPAIEFFRREDFPWLDTLEAATEDIAAEALAALAGDRAGFKPYVDFPASAPMDQWAPLNHSLDWSVYNLLDDGASIKEHVGKCPKTAAVLAQLPLCDIPEYAPGAYFSVLKPRTRLPAHTGTTNTRSIVHLPLVIPEGCGFRVGSQVRAWQKGKAWVFDDTIDHEAWNDSDQIRIVLIFDVWNPLLTAAERDLVRDFTVGLGRYYGADAPDLRSR
jgi:aspartyl/asparaginyl beta-hydroxylase (cupin superfamily)/Tfp pilus assembly protein PilF